MTKIAAGSWHSLFLKSDGSLWVMGYNPFGELGDGSFIMTNRPEQIVASNVTAIAAGEYHSLFLKSDGSLWAMGANFSGQLGDGANGIINLPERIVSSNVTAIAAGGEHSLFLKSDGSLWGMGANFFGQLGDGTFNATNMPEQIVSSNVVAISAGDTHSLFLKNDGSLWGMGNNDVGQLGDGTYGSAGNNFGINRPKQIVSNNVKAIAGGGGHTLFLKSDGSLWAMGWNYYGQLGDGTINYAGIVTPKEIVTNGVIAIAAGYYHSLFLKSDGSLWAMGYNGSGELGDGTLNDTNRPERILPSSITTIAAGFEHGLLLKSDGSLWAMGANESGQLGDGTTNSVARAEQILAAYNQISGQPLNGTNMQLSFVGIANANYALDRSLSLSPPNWIPQITNQASSYGPLILTNAPVVTTNNFWRIRLVP